ncbi:hypothetical protein BDZ45DRAFT_499057 [Acephala macrosclerotiorum]|nr:hypothetical protein BDZ45DRAFT_499057 [Acephala macrosclerotiorum]
MSWQRKGKNWTGSRYPPHHLRDLAFTLKGWAMEDKLANRKPFEVMTAEHVSYNCFLNVVNSFHRKYSGYSRVFRPSMRYTKEELAPADGNYTRYLVVGYIKWDKDMNTWRSPHHDTRTGVIIGYQQPESGVEDWISKTAPLFVITPIPTWKVGKTVKPKFYALLHPRDGLCTPYLIEEQYKFMIFWRWEFRSKASSIQKRTCNTHRRIRKQIQRFRRQGYGVAPYIHDADLSNNEETDQEGAGGDNSEADSEEENSKEEEEEGEEEESSGNSKFNDLDASDLNDESIEKSDEESDSDAPQPAWIKPRRGFRRIRYHESDDESESESPEAAQSANIPQVIINQRNTESTKEQMSAGITIGEEPSDEQENDEVVTTDVAVVGGSSSGRTSTANPSSLEDFVDELKKKLREREEALVVRENALMTLEAEKFKGKEEALNAREESLKAEEEKLQSDRVLLQEKEDALNAREKALKASEGILRGDQKRLHQQKEDLKSAEARVNARERNARDSESKLNTRKESMMKSLLTFTTEFGREEKLV